MIKVQLTASGQTPAFWQQATLRWKLRCGGPYMDDKVYVVLAQNPRANKINLIHQVDFATNIQATDTEDGLVELKWHSACAGITKFNLCVSLCPSMLPAWECFDSTVELDVLENSSLFVNYIEINDRLTEIRANSEVTCNV